MEDNSNEILEIKKQNREVVTEFGHSRNKSSLRKALLRWKKVLCVWNIKEIQIKCISQRKKEKNQEVDS